MSNSAVKTILVIGAGSCSPDLHLRLREALPDAILIDDADEPAMQALRKQIRPRELDLSEAARSLQRISTSHKIPRPVIPYPCRRRGRW